MTFNIIFWLCFYLFFFALSVYIGRRKGNLIAGVLLGYVLGPIGALLMYFSKDRRHVTCPSCQQLIEKNAYICPHCRSKVGIKVLHS